MIQGLVGLVSKIASGSADVVSTLFELDIGRILKDVLSNSDVSQGTPSPRALHNNNAQVCWILLFFMTYLSRGFSS